MTRLCCLLLLAAPPAALAAGEDAVVRIPSHGVSATVVWTGPGKTLILGCAHGFTGAPKPIRIDAPHPAPGTPRPANIRLIKVDHDLDLSLLSLDDGPLPYVATIAPAGHRPARLASLGYDEMRSPPQNRPTHIVRDDGRVVWTRERPWHGRSGGGLIDTAHGYLIGVCSGYTGPRNHQEVWPGAEGIYVAPSAIRRFLGWDAQPRLAPADLARPFPLACPKGPT